MTWQLRVDKTLCGATGMCAALTPELFELRDAYAEPVRSEIEPDELALDAADQCPMQAILVTENGKEIGPRP
ncbi:ferredoxin [Actinophytocola sp.]|uniref:ferredoxin n=1 Tax=Actinophytocola sp. TaxID=1872138 RepID=UPI003899E7D9